MKRLWSLVAFPVAKLLDRSRSLCWAELAMLSLGDDLRHWKRATDTWVCRQDCEATGSCWCGKFKIEEGMDK